jgi:serine/threonine protein phosphatase PrpC/uncharacterized protein with HEPN domain
MAMTDAHIRMLTAQFRVFNLMRVPLPEMIRLEAYETGKDNTQVIDNSVRNLNANVQHAKKIIELFDKNEIQLEKELGKEEFDALKEARNKAVEIKNNLSENIDKFKLLEAKKEEKRIGISVHNRLVPQDQGGKYAVMEDSGCGFELKSNINNSAQMTTLLKNTFQEVQEQCGKNVNQGVGATLVTSIIQGNTIYTANAGDSPGFVFTRDKNGNISVERLTREHEPSNPDEHARLYAAADAYNKSLKERQQANPEDKKLARQRPIPLKDVAFLDPGKPWKMYKGLSITRGIAANFSDLISHEPDISAVKVSIPEGGTASVLLASDGLFEGFHKQKEKYAQLNINSEEDYLKYLVKNNGEKSGDQLTQALTAAAMADGSKDNISAAIAPVGDKFTRIVAISDGNGSPGRDNSEVANAIRDKLSDIIHTEAQKVLKNPPSEKEIEQTKIQEKITLIENMNKTLQLYHTMLTKKDMNITEKADLESRYKILPALVNRAEVLNAGISEINKLSLNTEQRKTLVDVQKNLPENIQSAKNLIADWNKKELPKNSVLAEYEAAEKALAAELEHINQKIKAQTAPGTQSPASSEHRQDTPKEKTLMKKTFNLDDIDFEDIEKATNAVSAQVESQKSQALSTTVPSPAVNTKEEVKKQIEESKENIVKEIDKQTTQINQDAISKKTKESISNIGETIKTEIKKQFETFIKPITKQILAAGNAIKDKVTKSFAGVKIGPVDDEIKAQIPKVVKEIKQVVDAETSKITASLSNMSELHDKKEIKQSLNSEVLKIDTGLLDMKPLPDSSNSSLTIPSSAITMGKHRIGH